MTSFDTYCKVFFEKNDKIKISDWITQSLFEQYKYSAAKRDLLSIEEDVTLCKSHAVCPHIPFVKDFISDFSILLRHLPIFKFENYPTTRIEEITSIIFNYVFANSRTTYSKRVAKDLFTTHLLNPEFIDPLGDILIGFDTQENFKNVCYFINCQWNIKPSSELFSNFCQRTFPEFNKMIVERHFI